MKKILFLIFGLSVILLKADTSVLNKTDLVKLTKEEKLFLIEKEIRCVATKNWPPFNFEENGQLIGISH
ncbi:MAG: hypothetical protein ACPGUI_04800, partial [Halarcobacter sp.]